MLSYWYWRSNVKLKNTPPYFFSQIANLVVNASWTNIIIAVLTITTTITEFVSWYYGMLFLFKSCSFFCVEWQWATFAFLFLLQKGDVFYCKRRKFFILKIIVVHLWHSSFGINLCPFEIYVNDDVWNIENQGWLKLNVPCTGGGGG